MDEQFPVNSGSVPPPSQSTIVTPHQLANFATFQNNTGFRRKGKETIRPIPKVTQIDFIYLFLIFGY